MNLQEHLIVKAFWVLFSDLYDFAWSLFFVCNSKYVILMFLLFAFDFTSSAIAFL